jgi:DNA-binding CsgD family transcriptional regulator
MTRLTARQTDVVRLVTQGLTNAQIGEKLHVTEDTVKTILRRAMANTGATNRTRLAALTLQADIDQLRAQLADGRRCGCCHRARQVLDTRRPLRHRIDDSHPWSRLYDDIRTALEESP